MLYIRRFITTVVAIILAAVWAAAEVPAGYYRTADGKSGAELLDALNGICSRGVFLSYGSGKGYTWEGFYYTDRRDDGTVIDMYSDEIHRQTDFDAVSGLHIEHSLPKSWWGGLENYAYRDLHHLFPAEETANMTKNNLPLGETDEPTFDNGVSKTGPNTRTGASGNCFEPADEYKGDFARAYMYVSATYNELEALWKSPMMNNERYPVWNDWARTLLLEWHRQDPVSDKEKTRQEAVYGIQHNRNPFIDYPELAEHIWGTKSGEPFALPTDTRPYLTSPDRWSAVSIPAAMVGSDVLKELSINGYNFTGNMALALKIGTGSISLSKTNLTPDELQAGTVVDLLFTADEVCSIVDTIVLTATGFTSIEIPLEANFTDEFMMTQAIGVSPVEAEMEWMEKQDATAYTLTVYEGYRSTASDLIISGYYEGSSYNKAIAIYNGTGRSVDLSYYSIKKQSNGTGAFASDWQLSGTLVDGKTHVLVHAQADGALLSMADATNSNKESNPLSFNGNDVVALYHNNILTDMVGEEDNSTMWGENSALRRNSAVGAPSRHFDWAEWTKQGTDDYSFLASHSRDAVTEDPSPLTYTTAQTSYTISGLRPNTRYTAHITTPSGSTCNSITFITPALQSPEAYPATEVAANAFTANWEPVPHASGYIISLYTVIGTGEETRTEHFDNVGASGKPLPEGWTGTASGNYTSATSSGATPPSVALKNKLEWLATPATPQAITAAQFMYRYPSAATGSYFLVYAIEADGDEVRIDSVPYVNTSKTTLSYDAAALGTATHALKIVYHKDKGNLAIDDFTYSYGTEEKVFQQEYYTEAEGSHSITELTVNTVYSYTVAATTGHGTADEYRSAASGMVSVATSIPTGTDNAAAPRARIFSEGHRIVIDAVNPTATVSITNTAGQLLYNRRTGSATHTALMPAAGIYIVRINTSHEQETHKITVR